MKKNIFFLSFFLIAIVSFASWYQYSFKKNEKTEQLRSTKPMGLITSESQILMIRLNASRGMIEIKCDSVSENKCNLRHFGKWKVGNLVADQKAVKNFLTDALQDVGIAIDLSVETSEKRNAILKEYGLKEEQRQENAPYLEISYVDEKGVSRKIREWFGSGDMSGTSTFVGIEIDGKMNEEKTFLVHDRFKNDALGKIADDFRSRSPNN